MSDTRQTISALIEQKHALDLMLEANEGELPVDAEEAWDLTTGALNERFASWCLWVDARERQAEAIRQQEAWLKSKRTRIEVAISESRNELLRRMEQAGTTKVVTDLYTLSIATSERVELAPHFTPADIWNNQDIPEDIRRRVIRLVPETPEVDKNGVKALAKEGWTLPAGLAVVTCKSLRIK